MSEEQKQATPEATADQANELTINDLQAMKVIIDIASSRGAFKPNEMVAVGQTYTKLTGFLDAVAAQQKANPAPEGQPQSATSIATGA